MAKSSSASRSYEAKLWLTADKLHNNMDAAEYKHVALGLIFLKFISDAFEERHQKLLAEVSEGADPEDPDEYRADNVSWVPMETRSQTLQDNAKQPTIGKLIDEAMMNLAIRGIEGDLGPEHADTFRRDLHKDLKADYVLAYPPFNDLDWHRSDDDVRWKYGLPPKGNANFAWVQHFIHHLSPSGFAGFVLANGSVSGNHSAMRCAHWMQHDHP